MWVGKAMIASVLVPEAIANVMIGLKAVFPPITGYTPKSSVYQHSQIDKDQAEFQTLCGDQKWAEAKTIYLSGKNSVKSVMLTVGDVEKTPPVIGDTVKQGAVVGVVAALDTGVWTVKYESNCIQTDPASCFIKDKPLTWTGSGTATVSNVENQFRTLAGFSSEADAKMTGEEYFDMYKAYYKSGQYAHDAVTQALDGADLDDDTRSQVAKKTSAYENVWMYVIHEMQGAIKDCEAQEYDKAVHSWDEAVAFYSGSLEMGSDVKEDGKLLHNLGEKRCKNYGTCADDKINVNKLVLGHFKQGQTKLSEKKCDEVNPIKKSIVELMSVPLLQGALRYAYKVDQMSEADRKNAHKERAEGHVFASAIVPRIHKCDEKAADLFMKNLKWDAEKPMADGLAKVREAVESTYQCLGINCALVGGLLKDDKSDGFKACEDPGDSGASPLGHIGGWAVFCWALVVYQQVI